MILSNFLTAVAFLLLPLGMLWVASQRVMRSRERSRVPFTGKLLRPAGEGLRVEIEELNWRLSDLFLRTVALGVLPAICWFGLARVPTGGSIGLFWIAIPAASLAGAVWYWRRAMGVVTDIRNRKLGFDGERYVAEALVPLVAKGYRVFHDVVMDDRPGGENAASGRFKFNIDHLVVGPAGVFAVETKAKRKPNLEGVSNRETCRVDYDGKTLRFPDGFESVEWLDQAHRQAVAVSDWLTGTGGRRVPVVPVLVIPGWWIERQGKGRVHVLNEKELEETIPSIGVGQLDASDVQRIADRLADRGR